MAQIVMYRGDKFPLSITVKDKSTGLPIDLVAASLKLTANKVINPTDISQQVFTVDGVIDADPTTGICEFVIDLTTVPFHSPLYYDIQYIDSSGYIRTIVKDTIVVQMDITK